MSNYKISTFRSEPDERGIHKDVKTVVFGSIAADTEAGAAKEAFEKLTKWRKLPEIIPVKANGRYTAFVTTKNGLESVGKVLTIVVDEIPEEKTEETGASQKRKGRKNNQ